MNVLMTIKFQFQHILHTKRSHSYNPLQRGVDVRKYGTFSYEKYTMFPVLSYKENLLTYSFQSLNISTSSQIYSSQKQSQYHQAENCYNQPIINQGCHENYPKDRHANLKKIVSAKETFAILFSNLKGISRT